jgi:glycosyltransferase involved in cell wall biosynthesis
LLDCLNQVADLEYPSFEIRIVVDHESDPSAAVVRGWMQQHPGVRVTVQVLREISPSAYLKASAVRQCLGSIDRRVQVAVIVDADTMVYPTWLKDMVRPMIGTKVGVVTGNRWYNPTAIGWGSLVRYIYNANAVAPMYFMRATWGGSLAIRREVFDQPYFSKRMWNTSSEESAIQDANRHAGFDLALQPNALLYNEDSTDLASCFRFIRRQLLWTRLYHPEWSKILAGTAIYYGLLVAATVAAGLAAWREAWSAVGLLGGAIALVNLFNLVLIEWLHGIVSQRIWRAQKVRVSAIGWGTRVRLLAALPVALVIHSFATFAAALARQVTWRGIRYQVQPPDGLKLVKYQPFLSQAPLSGGPVPPGARLAS